MGKTSERGKLPKAGEGKRDEGGYLGYLLRQAFSAYQNRVERALADIGVTPPQFSVLTMLARMALLTPQTVNVIVANLKKAGRYRVVHTQYTDGFSSSN